MVSVLRSVKEPLAKPSVGDGVESRRPCSVLHFLSINFLCCLSILHLYWCVQSINNNNNNIWKYPLELTTRLVCSRSPITSGNVEHCWRAQLGICQRCSGCITCRQRIACFPWSKTDVYLSPLHAYCILPERWAGEQNGTYLTLSARQSWSTRQLACSSI